MDNLLAGFLLVSVLITVSQTYDTSNASALETFLKSSYHKNVRPSETTKVDLGAGLFHITSLDIVSQQMFLAGYIYCSWTDDRLKWTASDYGGLSVTQMKMSDVWVPPLVLNNAANGIELISDYDGMAGSYVTVSAGIVLWVTAANIVSQCTVDITYYPFDQQRCFMIFTSWSYSAAEVSLFTTSTSLLLDLYEENGEWDLVTAGLENYTRTVGETPLPGVRFSLLLRRKYSYYMMNMILPVIILAVVGAFVFVLPIESGEKIGFALTILLSMSVVMTTVSDNIPPISTQTCQLSVYTLVVFIICSVETLCTVLSCQVHSYHAKGYIPGSRLQKLILTVAKISCYGRPRSGADDTRSNTKSLSEKKYTKEDLGEKKKAWEGNDGNYDVKGENIAYTYEECAFIFDRVNFFVFLIVQTATTTAFFIALQMGGANQF
ncbi:neuronal acetylcholine receptor subunit beta-3-like [Mya arenaria]|uniref:neuronal acetylcholine receptor subunit beta-3-like n=1 Tax=Mya arenaria TaxID=6604 RepID=UPI0022DE9794|nr:neuronal acetylcholine receptor subunit beta-3-like [Mya arenaria]